MRSGVRPGAVVMPEVYERVPADRDQVVRGTHRQVASSVCEDDLVLFSLIQCCLRAFFLTAAVESGGLRQLTRSL